MAMKRKCVVFGSSVTTSWGNNHCATYRGLLRELSARGHHLVFVERYVPLDADRRDLPKPTFCDLVLYRSLEELDLEEILRDTDFAIVGSRVVEGVELGERVLREARCPVAFYDLDTPTTLATLDRGECGYLTPRLVGRYALYLSATGGPTLDRLMLKHGAPKALPLYHSFDPSNFYPEDRERTYDLGFLGNYAEDRQPSLKRLMLEAASQWTEGSFVVAGPMFPGSLAWPANVKRIEHLPPSEHRAFYNSQRFALNVTKADKVRTGWSPSARVFEAAGCGVPVISDWWAGIGDLFAIDREILVSAGPERTMRYLTNMPEWRREQIGECARQRVLSEHTAAHRAEQLEGYMEHALMSRAVTLL